MYFLFPQGGVTLYGLKYNITVGVLFIKSWLSGKFSYFVTGTVTVWTDRLLPHVLFCR